MLRGESRTVEIIFNSDITDDLNAALELKAEMAIGRRTLLRYIKGGGAGYNGSITVDLVNSRKCTIRLLEEHTSKLVDGDLYMTVWLREEISGAIYAKAFKVKLCTVGITSSATEQVDGITVNVDQEIIPVLIGEVSVDETDPTVPDHVKAIEQSDIDSWDEKASAASVTAEATARAGADTTLQNNINAEATARAAADAAVQLDLNLHKANFNNPHGVTKAQLGLGNVPDVDTTDRVVLNLLPDVPADGENLVFDFTLPGSWGGQLEDHFVAVYADTDFGSFIVTRISNAVMGWYVISGNTLTFIAPAMPPTVVFIDVHRNFNV